MAPGLMEIFQLELSRWKLFNTNIWYALPDGFWYVIGLCLPEPWLALIFGEIWGILNQWNV